jgi:hypothetical protein
MAGRKLIKEEYINEKFLEIVELWLNESTVNKSFSHLCKLAGISPCIMRDRSSKFNQDIIKEITQINSEMAIIKNKKTMLKDRK